MFSTLPFNPGDYAEVEMPDHAIADYLRDKDWSGRASHQGNCVFFFNKKEPAADCIMVIMFDNEECSRRVFLYRPSIFCIRNSRGDYWSNEWGWIELEDEDDDRFFSIFSKEEKATFTLPEGEGAYWQEL